MSQDVNKTMNGIQPSSCYWNPTAENMEKTFAFCLILLVSLAGNTVIGIIVYKKKTIRKPINFFIVNMAMSNLLFPIFLIPLDIQLLYINSWLIGGSLGEACKLVYLLITICFLCCVPLEPGYDGSGSIWSCGISPSFPTHQFKVVPRS